MSCCLQLEVFFWRGWNTGMELAALLTWLHSLAGVRDTGVISAERVGCVLPSPGRTERSIQRSFLFGSFHKGGSREPRHRPAACLLLSTCTGASASCSCLFSFAVKGSLVQTNTATDCLEKKSLERKSTITLAVMFYPVQGQGMFLTDTTTNWVDGWRCG